MMYFVPGQNVLIKDIGDIAPQIRLKGVNRKHVNVDTGF
jgi:hypothetical protein